MEAMKEAWNEKTVGNIVGILKPNKIHYYVLTIVALGFVFDSFDTYLMSYATPAVIKIMHISLKVSGLINSASIWGMMVGAVLWGSISDAFGRRVGFSSSVIVYSIFSVLTMFAQTQVELGVLRVLTGLGIGGMLPIVESMVAEYAPSKYRGRFLGFITILWPFGLLAAAILALNLISADINNWRYLFLIGGLPIVLLIPIFTVLPESPRWLQRKGKIREANESLQKLGAEVYLSDSGPVARGVPLSELLSNQYRARMLLAVGYYFFSYYGYYGFLLWLPAILSNVFNLSLVHTFTYTLYVAIAAILGRVTAFYTVEKFGRKQLFYVGFGLGGIMALVFGTLHTPGVLVAGAALLSFIYEQGVAGTVIYAPELFPTEVRSSATAWATAGGRLAAAISPIVFGIFISTHFYYGVFLTMAIGFWLAVVLVWRVGPETKGRSLEELGAE